MKVVLKKSTLHRPDLNVPRKVESVPGIPASVLREPNLADMLANFAEAAQRAKQYAEANGFPALVVTEQTFAGRLNEGCRKCPQKLWDENARLGLGKCKHPRCGCSKLKLWLASESCPLNAWPQ